MRRRILPLLACAFGLAAAAAVAAAEEGAKGVDAAWLKAVKANDVDALVACYWPDAVMWLPDAPEARGEKAIRAAYAGLLGANYGRRRLADGRRVPDRPGIFRRPGATSRWSSSPKPAETTSC